MIKVKIKRVIKIFKIPFSFKRYIAKRIIKINIRKTAIFVINEIPKTLFLKYLAKGPAKGRVI